MYHSLCKNNNKNKAIYKTEMIQRWFYNRKTWDYVLSNRNIGDVEHMSGLQKPISMTNLGGLLLALHVLHLHFALTMGT